MTQLYRIKPLEWRDNADTSAAGGYWILEHCDGVSDTYFECDCIFSHNSREEAKAACEAHRRKWLEAELEPLSYIESWAIEIACDFMRERHKALDKPVDTTDIDDLDREEEVERLDVAIQVIDRITKGEPTREQDSAANQVAATELPTEPGYYWFSSTGKSESWLLKVVVTSSRDKSKLLVVAGGGEYYESPLRGHWIRIPEPETPQ